MRNRRLKMVQVKEIIRLAEKENLSQSEIASSVKTTRKTIGVYLKKIAELEIKYEEVKDKPDSEIKKLLFPKSRAPIKERPKPNLDLVYREHKEKGVTRYQLWLEYRDQNSEGVSYQHFCSYLRDYKEKITLSMRQEHKFGEKCFIDFAGQTVPIIDKNTGEINSAQIFVAVLGGSSYTFAYAVSSQEKHNWLDCHVKMFEYFGGVTEILVPDNLRSGVDKACRYDPVINRSYQELAEHYDTVIIPARVRKPKDKAKAEKGVQMVQNSILGALRNREFFSVFELNEAIKPLLETLNSKPFQKLEGSRSTWFENYEKNNLKPLPNTKYEFSEWKKAKVNIDYHIDLEGHYYSVPYKFVKEEVSVCFNSRIVKIFHDNRVIASHQRDFKKGKHTLVKEHMPKSHREHLEWNPSRIINWAKSEIGIYTGQLIETFMSRHENPEITYKKCLGIISFKRKYPKERIEKASKLLLDSGIGKNPYQSMKSILLKGLEQRESEEVKLKQTCLDVHENIRGADSFSGDKTKEKNNDDK